MPETLHFTNDGYGWTCKRCRETGVSRDASDSLPLPRFFREGEAEDRDPRLSSPPLARWKDETRRALTCPRCGAEESIKN